MAARISVFNSRELQGVIAAMQGLDRAVAKEIRRATKAVVDPVWRGEVAKRAVTDLEQQVLGSTARVQVSDQNVTLQAAKVGRAIGGRVKPVDLLGGTEFGASRERVAAYSATSSRGRSFTVKRRTQRQFSPRRKTGYVVMPAVAATIPRIASLWVQTVVRTFYEQIEKGRG